MQAQQYVGIDLHRRRSVIVRRDAAGTTLEVARVDNSDREAFTKAVADAGEHPDVVVEATYGWYWLADLLDEAGARIHLAHPLGNAWGNRRVKNDTRDAEDLVDLYRLGRLVESWIAPPETRELRELVRYRAKLVALKSNAKVQIHSVLAKEGICVPMSDLFGVAGSELLDTLELADAYQARVESLRNLIDAYAYEIGSLDKMIYSQLADNTGYKAIQAIPGVGPVTAVIFVAEIGDVSRFTSPHHLASWVGLTPRHRESDTTVHRGPITKQGSKLVRWAAIEAATRQVSDSRLRQDFERIATNHGSKPGARKIARVAVARKIVHLVYYGLRDGVIRSLAPDEV
ncbi:MAG: IS110 family transposase [Actinomycetota bacterium]|nr:IS110 family transposase [Actinomycetota bacterium]